MKKLVITTLTLATMVFSLNAGVEPNAVSELVAEKLEVLGEKALELKAAAGEKILEASKQAAKNLVALKAEWNENAVPAFKKLDKEALKFAKQVADTATKASTHVSDHPVHYIAGVGATLTAYVILKKMYNSISSDCKKTFKKEAFDIAFAGTFVTAYAAVCAYLIKNGPVSELE